MTQTTVRTRRVVSIAIMCVLFAAAAVFAQATSTINGRVLDQGDAVLPGVTITVTNQATGVVRTALTNGDGVYSMPGLESGTYNVITSVDGADNRDNQFGGPLITFSTEALEQFQLATSQFNAADGRTAGAALTMITKSGTNAFHGSAFGFGRSDKLSAKDFFTAQANRENVPYSRAQFGGAFGGPLIRNRAFFFGAIERIREEPQVTVPDNLFAEQELLVQAMNAG